MMSYHVLSWNSIINILVLNFQPFFVHGVSIGLELYVHQHCGVSIFHPSCKCCRSLLSNLGWMRPWFVILWKKKSNGKRSSNKNTFKKKHKAEMEKWSDTKTCHVWILSFQVYCSIPSLLVSIRQCSCPIWEISCITVPGGLRKHQCVEAHSNQTWLLQAKSSTGILLNSSQILIGCCK